jgi:hypothetical protein
MYITLIFVSIVIIGFYSYSWNRKSNKDWKTPKLPFPTDWRTIVNTEVPYYRALVPKEKKKFEYKIQEFLLNCTVSGIGTEITDLDRILVASSAIIPIFGFHNWTYINLKEVLIYPTIFNGKFETEGPDRKILGMVGTGYMEGKMILSQEALIHGFQNESDKKNTAIHEFTHLIDKIDGSIDGIPSALLEKQYTIPWIDFMDQKLEEIYNGKSDINPYGGTNRAEFFSVTSEYFFERPKLLKKKHPELYHLLKKIFKQDLSTKDLSKPVESPSRNSKCPCESGEKYKNCCGSLQ